MIIFAIILILGGSMLRSWVSRTIAIKYRSDWEAAHDWDLNTAFLGGKDFRKFRSGKLRQDKHLSRLNFLATLLMIAGFAVVVLTPVIRADATGAQAATDAQTVTDAQAVTGASTLPGR